MKRKAKSQRVEISLSLEQVPLEAFVQLIEQGIIQEEIPFDLLAKHYPELLDEWYPGYPGSARLQTAEDPFPCRGEFRNGLLTLDLGKESLSMPLQEPHPPEGRYELLIKKDDHGEWIAYVTGEAEQKTIDNPRSRGGV
jgi:hypothetical protein